LQKNRYFHQHRAPGADGAPAIDPLGDARQDWKITQELAKRILAIGDRKVGEGSHTGWDYTNTSDILTEISALTPSYAGSPMNGWNTESGFNGRSGAWTMPVPHLACGSICARYGEISPIEHIPPAELPDEEFPVLLSTGRVLYHWHGGEMTRRARGLLAVYDRALIEVNPDDASRLGVNGNRRVRVSSRRGSIEAEAW